MIKSNIDSWSEQYSQMEEQSKQALDIIKTDTYIMLFISLVMIFTGSSHFIFYMIKNKKAG